MNSYEETIRRELAALLCDRNYLPPVRRRHLHRFHPVSRYCVDCTVSEVEHHAVPYGVGIECNLAKQVTR